MSGAGPAERESVTGAGPRSSGRRWLEDPNLDRLSPGQRYTALLVVLLSVLMLWIGVPRHHTASCAPTACASGR